MRRLIYFVIIIAFVFIFVNSVSAADALYRLMHNDHDALVIGEILDSSNGKLVLEVKHQIISSTHLNEGNPKEQKSLVGKEVTITGIHNNSCFTVGDFVLASIDKDKDNYINAWGIFQVNSPDYKTLKIILEEDSSEFAKMEAIAIKEFVNSNGKKNNFAFDGSKGIVYSDGEIIYECQSTAADSIDFRKSIDVESEDIVQYAQCSQHNYKKPIILLVLTIAIIGATTIMIKNK